MAVPAAAQNNAPFQRGYREGIQRGTDDARDGRRFEPQRDREYRDGDRGYNDRWGTREQYRNEFRRGFTSGYREGYYDVGDGRYRRDDRIYQGRTGGIYQGRTGGIYQGRTGGIYDRGPGRTRGYQEPAYARGYSDGWEKGVDDGRDRDRYDPVRHGDYKDADNGYERSYGSKDAYKNNYRSGFRQGYEEGYRSGTRTARR
jgi:flagellar biosynthesis/type III secretory pathway protein FliH